MSLYNALFGENPDAAVLIGFLGLNKEVFGRYRNAYLNKAGDKIIIYTRCGGGNRTEYERVFEMMKRHPNYLRDYDDDYDSTYAYIEFSVPDKYKATAQHMKPETEPLNVWDQFQNHMKNARENPNGPEAQKDEIIAEKIRKAMENPKPGMNFIEI